MKGECSSVPPQPQDIHYTRQDTVPFPSVCLSAERSLASLPLKIPQALVRPVCCEYVEKEGKVDRNVARWRREGRSTS